MVKTTCGLVVAILGAFAVTWTADASAAVKPTLSRQQAVQAAGKTLVSRVGRSAKVRSFGIDRCDRRGRLVFTCRGTLVRVVRSGSVDCGLTYRVKKRRAKVKATLIRKRCVARSGGDDSGDRGSGGDGDEDGLWIPGPLNPDNPFQRGPGPKYCPGYEGADSWDAEPDIVGKTYAEATLIAAEHGCTLRVTRIDGEYQVITMDLRYNRLNVEVEGPDQLITAIDSVA